MLARLYALSALLASAAAWPGAPKIKNLVSFGDSYTDSVNYIATGANATTWPQYVARYANLTAYPLAVAGATCSNALSPRVYRDVSKDQLALYRNLTGTVRLDPRETVYSLWIGTNDVGGDQLITAGSAPGTTIVSVSQCAVDFIKTLYSLGARNFLFQNMIPLDQTPMYSADAYPDRYWTAERNTTQWNIMMKELVASGNALTRLLLASLAPSLPGSTIAYFDSHALFTDIHARPAAYLNGTAPLNVTGAAVACVFAPDESTSAGGQCTVAQGVAKDSFLWYDELHPSEQADRVVARAVGAVLGARGRRGVGWTTFL